MGTMNPTETNSNDSTSDPAILPENSALLTTLDEMKQNLKEITPDLSVTGQQASHDLSELIQSTKRAIQETNFNGHLQNVYHHLYQAIQAEHFENETSLSKQMIEEVD